MSPWKSLPMSSRMSYPGSEAKIVRGDVPIGTVSKGFVLVVDEVSWRGCEHFFELIERIVTTFFWWILFCYTWCQHRV